MKRIWNIFLKYGILGAIIKLFKIIAYRFFLFFSKFENTLVKFRAKVIRMMFIRDYTFIKELLKNPKYKHIFVFFPYTEWNVPVFQRPQQIALSLSKREDTLYLFCSRNFNHDSYTTLYKKINENLYIITDYSFIKKLDNKNKILHLYSTDTISKYKEVEEFLSKNNKVLYEYIDEIHEDISGNIPKWCVEKHNKILRNSNVFVVATADKLLEDVKKIRKENYDLITNGVNVADFIPKTLEMHERIKSLKSKYEKTVCYYGSFAVWFDYELLKKCAEHYPNYAFLLIGMEYDSSLKESNVLSLENIVYIGEVKYEKLIDITKDVDLLTIPFLINEVTESTSPVKLFEYMATKKPILTTGIRECKKYKSVVFADNDEDFIRKIDSTIGLANNQGYIAKLWEEANQNSWDSKSDSIINLLSSK